MANRRITELPSIQGANLAEQDLLTLVRVFEVDPTLKNKKITLAEFNNYLNTKYLTFSGGTMTGPLFINATLTVTGQASFNAITSTGVSNFSGVFVENNLNVSGTLSGTTITGTTVNATNATFQNLTASGHTTQGNLTVSGTFRELGNSFFSSGVTVTGTLTGSTVTGVTANFQSGVFTGQISGASITGNTLNASTITGVSSVFTSQISGSTVTGQNAQFSTGVFQSLTAVNLAFIDTTVSGNLTVLGSGYFASGINVTDTVSGQTITGAAVKATNITGVNIVGTTSVSGATVTGNIGQFTNVTGVSGVFTAPSGSTPTLISSGVISGDAGLIIRGTITILP